ncbi:MAG TPA: hypothetical protein IAB70_07325 [Candidatus Merdicola faecigallinarum]|uniref:Uncharacterized protein n=1 Tax=Candidatus Merdicola faecigallinarum TaxID=2840862 RepID=A0A9D1M2H8_9FIRM|nr:hypothetical protein [Candidatus Merdicola faecigallinarum]
MKRISKKISKNSVYKIQTKHDKAILIGLILVLLGLISLYVVLISQSSARSSYANELVDIANQDKNPIFKIEKIILHSSADAIDNSDNQDLKDLSVCQYTDIAIYINNTSTIKELTNENTIQSLTIDQISLENSSNRGKRNLNYKLPYNFGKFRLLTENSSGKIDFNILRNNQDYESNSYAGPTFCTDCSVPITLGYVNQDIIEHYSVKGDSNQISFNGKILENANIPLADLETTIKFRINITSNAGKKYSYYVHTSIPLKGQTTGIYSGYVMSINQNPGSFFEVE